MIRIVSHTVPKEGAAATGGYSNSVVAVNAKIQSHNLWGQPFDGTNDVEGDISNAGNLTMSGTANIGNVANIGNGANVSGDVTVTSGCVITPCVSATSISADDIEATNISASTANLTDVTASTIVAEEITGETIEAESIQTTTLSAISGYIQSLLSKDIITDNLTVTKAAHFFELIIDKVRATQGQVILTPANAKFVKVVGSRYYFRCYFRATDGETEISNNFVDGDLVVHQTFNVTTGTSHDISNRYYWRYVITSVSNVMVNIDGEDVLCHYIDLSRNAMDPNSNATPQAGDEVVQLGNSSEEHTDRCSAIILSAYNNQFLDPTIKAPSIVQYNGINDYDLSTHRVNIISADLNSLNVNGTLYHHGVEIGSAMTNIEQSLSAVTTTVSAHTDTLSAHTEELSEIDVSLSGINATVSGQQDTITGLTTAVSMLNLTMQGITQRVSGLTVGTGNLIDKTRELDGGETDTHNTPVSGSDGFYYDFIDDYEEGSCTTFEYNFVPNEDYVFSFEVSGNCTFTTSAYYSYYDQQTGQNVSGGVFTTATDSEGHNTTRATGELTNTINGDWKRFWFKWHTNSVFPSGIPCFYIDATFKTTTDGGLRFRKPKLERAKIPSEWSANLEDNDQNYATQTELRITSGGLNTRVSVLENEDWVTQTELDQSVSAITLSVYGELSDDLRDRTGIDITNGHITLDADNTTVTGQLGIMNTTDGIVLYDENSIPRLSFHAGHIADKSAVQSLAYSKTLGGEGTYYGETTVDYTTPLNSNSLIGRFQVGSVIHLDSVYLRASYSPVNYWVRIVYYNESTQQYVTALETSGISSAYTSVTINSAYTVAQEAEYHIQTRMVFTKEASNPTSIRQTTTNGSVEVVGETLSEIGVDGLDIIQGNNKYSYFGPDLTELHFGNSGIRLYSGTSATTIPQMYVGTRGTVASPDEVWGTLGQTTNVAFHSSYDYLIERHPEIDTVICTATGLGVQLPWRYSTDGSSSSEASVNIPVGKIIRVKGYNTTLKGTILPSGNAWGNTSANYNIGNAFVTCIYCGSGVWMVH